MFEIAFYNVVLNFINGTMIDSHMTTGNISKKPVGNCISAPSRNFVAMATRVGLTTFCMVPFNSPSPKILW